MNLFEEAVIYSTVMHTGKKRKGTSTPYILHPLEVSQIISTIETSLVVASALQSAGFNTFLVFPPGHAQVAVETWPGNGDYFVIETTSLTPDSCDWDAICRTATEIINNRVIPQYSGCPITFYSNDEWLEYLSECDYLIDCSDNVRLGLTNVSN